jgi:hypothetical protein
MNHDKSQDARRFKVGDKFYAIVRKGLHSRSLFGNQLAGKVVTNYGKPFVCTGTARYSVSAGDFTFTERMFNCEKV